MWDYKHLGMYTILLWITLFAWGICLVSAEKIQASNHTMELRYTEEKPSISQMEAILKELENQTENKVLKHLVAWEETSEETIRNEVLGIQTTTKVMQIIGESKELIPRDKLTGDALISGDKKGIVITKELAYELWRSTDVLGKSLQWQEEEYVVRGILQAKGKWMLMNGTSDRNKEGDTSVLTFSALRLTYLEKDNLGEAVPVFTRQFGLPEPTVIDRSSKSILLSQLAFLPGWILGCYVLWKLYSLCYHTYPYWKPGLVLGVITIMMTVVIVGIIKFVPEIPSAYIPNKWSNFDFWSRLFTTTTDNREAVALLPKLQTDLWIGSEYNRLYTSFIVALGGFMILLRKKRREALAYLGVYVLLAILTSFLVILGIYYLNGYGLQSIMFWLIWPTYLMCHFIAIHWKDILKGGCL